MACRTGSGSGLDMKLPMVYNSMVKGTFEAGQFPMFGHTGLLYPSSVLGDKRFKWLYLEFFNLSLSVAHQYGCASI